MLQMKTIAGAVMAVALLSPVASHAATVLHYDFTSTDVAAFGSGVFGTVTATQVGSNVKIDVALADGFQFRYAPDANHHALAFDLATTGKSITGLTTAFQQDAGTSFSAAGFGNWNYAVDCGRGSGGRTKTACQPGWTPGVNPTTLSFNVLGVTLSDFQAEVQKSGKGVYFVADVVNSKGATGNIGAVMTASVPEPSTWAMMIVGVGAVGLALRDRRRKQAAAEAVLA